MDSSSAVQRDISQPYSSTVENGFKITGLALVVSGIALIVIGEIMHLSLLYASIPALAGGSSFIAFGYCVHCCKAAALSEDSGQQRVRTSSLAMRTIRVDSARAEQDGVPNFPELEPLRSYLASEERSGPPPIRSILLWGESKSWVNDVTRLLRNDLKARNTKMIRLAALTEHSRISQLFTRVEREKDKIVFVIIEDIDIIYNGRIYDNTIKKRLIEKLNSLEHVILVGCTDRKDKVVDKISFEVSLEYKLPMKEVLISLLSKKGWKLADDVDEVYLTDQQARRNLKKEEIVQLVEKITQELMSDRILTKEIFEERLIAYCNATPVDRLGEHGFVGLSEDFNDAVQRLKTLFLSNNQHNIPINKKNTWLYGPDDNGAFDIAKSLEKVLKIPNLITISVDKTNIQQSFGLVKSNRKFKYLVIIDNIDFLFNTRLDGIKSQNDINVVKRFADLQHVIVVAISPNKCKDLMDKFDVHLFCGSRTTERFAQRIREKGWRLSEDVGNLYLKEGEFDGVVEKLDMLIGPDEEGPEEQKRDEPFTTTITRAMLVKAIHDARSVDLF